MFECQYQQVKSTRVLTEEGKLLKIEGELFLPEGYPELQTVFGSQGYLGEVRGEIDGKNLSLYGQIEAHLFYAGAVGEEEPGEYGFVWSGAGSINFAEILPLPGVSAATIAHWNWDTQLTSFTLEGISAQRVRYTAELLVKVTAWEEQLITVINSIDSEVRVETVTERVTFEELVAVAQGSREVSNQFQISYPKMPVARIIGYNGKAGNIKSTVSKGRVIIEGFLEIDLVYVGLGVEGEEAGIAAVSWNQQNGGALPFQLVLEEPSASPEQLALPKVWVESLYVNSPHPEVCRVQGVVGAKAKLVSIHSEQPIFEVSVDEENHLDVLGQNWEVEEVISETEKVLQIEKTLTLPAENLNLEEVLLVVSSCPKLLECEADAERVFIEGEVDLSILYSGEGEMGSVLSGVVWDQQSPDHIVFGEFIDLPSVEEGMSASATLMEDGIKVEVLDERSVQVNIDYKAQIMVKAHRELSLVLDCALVIKDEQPKPSMLFYLAQKGDNLWKVARRYNTTMKAIAVANNLSATEELAEGLKLFIPKSQ